MANRRNQMGSRPSPIVICHVRVFPFFGHLAESSLARRNSLGDAFDRLRRCAESPETLEIHHNSRHSGSKPRSMTLA